MITIGDRIRAAREAKDLNPTEVAAIIKKSKGISISPQAIYQIESGATKNPKPENILAIADVLHEDVIYLISGTRRKPQAALKLVSDEPHQPRDEGVTDSDEFIELLALYQQSDSKGRQYILKSARVASKERPVRWFRSDETKV